MEQEHQYLAFIFVFQADLGRSIWSSQKSIGLCEHKHLAHPCHGSAPELLGLHSHCQVAHRSYFPSPTALSKRDGTTNFPQNYRKLGILQPSLCRLWWWSLALSWVCGGTGDTTCSFSWQGKGVPSERPSWGPKKPHQTCGNVPLNRWGSPPAPGSFISFSRVCDLPSDKAQKSWYQLALMTRFLLSRNKYFPPFPLIPLYLRSYRCPSSLL